MVVGKSKLAAMAPTMNTVRSMMILHKAWLRLNVRTLETFRSPMQRCPVRLERRRAADFARSVRSPIIGGRLHSRGAFSFLKTPIEKSKSLLSASRDKPSAAMRPFEVRSRPLTCPARQTRGFSFWNRLPARIRSECVDRATALPLLVGISPIGDAVQIARTARGRQCRSHARAAR
jgi:hypothetical protein